jgi:rhamnosyltransferase
MSKQRTVSVVVPIYNGGVLWQTAAEKIHAQQSGIDSVVVIDSGSSDGSAAVARQYGFDVHIIDACEFDHGKTRNYALEFVSSDYVIFMTQDAVLADETAIPSLLSAFDDENVMAAYGRQLPAINATPPAAHARIFNYPSESIIKSADVISLLGIKAAFISNSFAAYRVAYLRELGGFPEKVIFAEDMFLGAKIISSSGAIAYCAQAAVYHSHNYTLAQEFRRYFDAGVFHAQNSGLRDLVGQVEGEGVRFVRSELQFLWQRAPRWMPIAILSTLLKWCGFKLGLHYEQLPKSWRQVFSMNKKYWLR